MLEMHEKLPMLGEIKVEYTGWLLHESRGFMGADTRNVSKVPHGVTSDTQAHIAIFLFAASAAAKRGASLGEPAQYELMAGGIWIEFHSSNLGLPQPETVAIW